MFKERALPFLLLLLAASGCAALIYEIVWFQLLQLVIGSSAVSLGLLLAAYMGGLCLGSAALSRVVPASEHPLRIYAFLELGIGAFGILALFGVPLIGRLYIAGPTTGIAGVILRGLIAAICLLPPTVLMGASFPAIARRVGTDASRLGLLYSANIASTVAAVPWQSIAYGRRVAPILRDVALGGDLKPATPLFIGEGINSSVVITDNAGERNFYVSGKAEASSTIIDMRLQRMMGHLPALVNGSAKSVLVVGFGAGVTAGSFVPYPDVQSIVICELEPIIPPASDEFFGKQNYHVLHDPRTRVVYDDARHGVLTAPDKFDVITTDPDSSVGQGHLDALFEGILRTGEKPFESWRSRRAMAAHLRERQGNRRHRNGDLLRGLSRRYRVEQLPERRWL